MISQKTETRRSLANSWDNKDLSPLQVCLTSFSFPNCEMRRKNSVPIVEIYLFVCLSVHPSTFLPILPSISQSILPFIHPSTHPPFDPSIHPSTHPFIHSSIHPSVRPPTHLFIQLSGSVLRGGGLRGQENLHPSPVRWGL